MGMLVVDELNSCSNKLSLALERIVNSGGVLSTHC